VTHLDGLLQHARVALAEAEARMVAARLEVLVETGEAIDAGHASIDRWTRLVHAVGDAHDDAVRARLELLYLFAYRCRVPPAKSVAGSSGGSAALISPTLASPIRGDGAETTRAAGPSSGAAMIASAMLGVPAADVIRADGAAQFLRAAIVPSVLEALEFAVRAPELRAHPDVLLHRVLALLERVSVAH
jgi:hypothetical protein